MGQIAACLTDLICLIEQRDAFGFTSPSKAADSASVKKKRGRGEKGKEKHPHDISIATGVHLHTLKRLPEALFVSFKLLIHRCSAQALSGHRPPTMAARLENLSTVGVIDQRQNSADDWSPLKPAAGTRLAPTVTQLIHFPLTIHSTPVCRPIHSFVDALASSLWRPDSLLRPFLPPPPANTKTSPDIFVLDLNFI